MALQVQRGVTSCSIRDPDRLGDLLDALYHAFWFEKKGVQLAEVYEPILRTVLGETKTKDVLEYVSCP